MVNIFKKFFKKSEVIEKDNQGAIVKDDIYTDENRQVASVTKENKSLKDLIRENGKGFKYESFDKTGNSVTMEVTEIVEHPSGGMIVYSRSV